MLQVFEGGKKLYVWVRDRRKTAERPGWNQAKSKQRQVGIGRYHGSETSGKQGGRACRRQSGVGQELAASQSRGQETESLTQDSTLINRLCNSCWRLAFTPGRLV